MSQREILPFSEAELCAAAEAAGLKLYILDKVDSTSEECRRRAAVGERGFAVIAGEQSRGRGRSGRSFYSPAGTGLYMSILLDTGGELDPAGITTRAAVYTVQAIKDVCGISCGIKWVNDLILDGRKVCGILAESPGPGLVILGVGINLEESPLPPELKDIVGFLRCGEKKNALAARLLSTLASCGSGDGSHMEIYRRLSVVTGRMVSFVRRGERVRGLALDIDDSGGLIVKTEKEIITLSSGEISLTDW